MNGVGSSLKPGHRSTLCSSRAPDALLSSDDAVQSQPLAPPLIVMLLRPYKQGDNIMHGLCCRLESPSIQDDLFFLGHTMHNHDTGGYKVSGCCGSGATR